MAKNATIFFMVNFYLEERVDLIESEQWKGQEIEQKLAIVFFKVPKFTFFFNSKKFISFFFNCLW